MPVTVPFPDISIAFDLVYFEKLISTCEHYSIYGMVLEWIRSYLMADLSV